VISNRFRSLLSSSPSPTSAYSDYPIKHWDTIDWKLEMLSRGTLDLPSIGELASVRFRPLGNISAAW
jgi:hypothetical protein